MIKKPEGEFGGRTESSKGGFLKRQGGGETKGRISIAKTSAVKEEESKRFSRKNSRETRSKRSC